MQDFKVGDQVRCIRSSHWGVGRIIRIHTLAGQPHFRVFFKKSKTVKVLSVNDIQSASQSFELLMEEKQHLEKLLKSYERNLAEFENEADKYSFFLPPHLSSQIKLERAEVRRILERLLEIHTIALSRLQRKATAYGETRIPPQLSIQIAGVKADIARLEGKLGDLLSRKTYHRTMRIGLAWLITAIVIGIVVIITFRYYQESRARQWTSIPSGRLGIVLAEFGGGPEFEKTSVGEGITELLYRDLDKRLKETGLAERVVVRKMGLTRGEEEARGTGKDIGADIVVWGWVPAGKRGALVPNFSLIKGSEESRAEPQELRAVGSETVQLSEQPSTRIKVLTTFIVGLAYLLENDHEGAIEKLTAALDAAEGEDQNYNPHSPQKKSLDECRAVLHLFKGRAHAITNKLELAIADYRKAIEWNPEYARPHIDLGNVYFVQGAFEESIEEYRQVIESETARDEDRALAYYSTALAYIALGKADGAMWAFREAIEGTGADIALREVAEKGLETLIKQAEGSLEPTATPSYTAVPPTDTPTPSVTPALAPATATPIVPRPTPTRAPTRFPTPTPWPWPTPTVQPTPTPSPMTPTPTEELTLTPATVMPTPTVEPTLAPSATAPSTVTPGPMPTATWTSPPTETLMPTETAPPAGTASPTLAPSPTPSLAPTEPPTPTVPPTGLPSLTSPPTSAPSPTSPPTEPPAATPTPVPLLPSPTQAPPTSPPTQAPTPVETTSPPTP